jgi:choline dehydrogenase-like flavoprotein
MDLNPPDPRFVKTHQALFDTWFPVETLPIPLAIRPDISQIATQVSGAMLTALSDPNSLFGKILYALTYPQYLPFYDCLSKSTNPAVQTFIKTGYGDLPADLRRPLLAFLYEGTCTPLSAQWAMMLREAYLSSIWDLPLAVPLTEMQPPQIFMQNVEIYSKVHAPAIPESKLYYDAKSKTIQHRDGPIEYLVIGSGPGGATVAHQMWKAGKRVVLIEKGPFVVWGSMNTMSYPRLMFQGDRATTSDNGVIIRSGEVMGGGSTVNIDLAFSPLEGTIQARIDEWSQQGLMDAAFYTPSRIAAAYQWVREAIETREVFQSELNNDNLVLWDGAAALGVNPSLYHLNRFATESSPSAVTTKKDAARQLILQAIQDASRPLSVIPDAEVNQILFKTDAGGGIQATGASLTLNPAWVDYQNTIVDPCRLQIPASTTVSINAENVVVSAGTLGTTRILLNSAKTTPAIANPRIGKGIILHPSFPLIGVFDREINLLEGLDSATFVDSFGVTPGFIFEAMTGLPAYGALLIPGTGQQVYEHITKFNTSAGFGVMLVDTPSDSNCVTLDDAGNIVVNYALSAEDKKRFATGVNLAIRMMFLAGAKEVIIPSNENFLNQSQFDPTQGTFLTSIDQADVVEQNIAFIPNRTVLTSAHLQATNKIGPSPQTAVVSTRQRVWNIQTGKEVPNLYVMDSSIFPTSVGANPMQSIYSFAKIFSDRLINGFDDKPKEAMRPMKQPAQRPPVFKPKPVT